MRPPGPDSPRSHRRAAFATAPGSRGRVRTALRPVSEPRRVPLLENRRQRICGALFSSCRQPGPSIRLTRISWTQPSMNFPARRLEEGLDGRAEDAPLWCPHGVAERRGLATRGSFGIWSTSVEPNPTLAANVGSGGAATGLERARPCSRAPQPAGLDQPPDALLVSFLRDRRWARSPRSRRSAGGPGCSSSSSRCVGDEPLRRASARYVRLSDA